MTNTSYTTLPPVEYVINPELSSSAGDPYYVSSVSTVNANFLHLLRVNLPAWSNSCYQTQYMRIDLNYFFNSIAKNFIYSDIKNDNSLEDLLRINPIAVRYFTSDGIFFIERPPFKATLRFHPIKASGVTTKTTLIEKEVWIPWQVYIVNYDIELGKFIFKIYFHHKPIDSLDNNLSIAWLPNLFGDGGVCWGQDNNIIKEEVLQNKTKTNKNIFDIICSQYWQGGWNADILPSLYSIPTFLLPEFETKNDEDYAIYTKASQSADKSKLKNHMIRQYVDHLNIWSQYSLSDLLFLMSKYPANSSPKKLSFLIENAKAYDGAYSYNGANSFGVLFDQIFCLTHKYPNHFFEKENLSLNTYFSTGLTDLLDENNQPILLKQSINEEHLRKLLFEQIQINSNNATSLNFIDSIQEQELPF
jgi:hypothetical protein